jgi:hypothetical protein
MVEVRAVKDAYVLADSSDATPIPNNEFVTVELTPHIALAIRAGDLERRPRSAEQPTAQDASRPAEPLEASREERPAQVAAGPSKQEENETAIELAAQELREDPKLTRAKLYARLLGPRDKRAPSLRDKQWVTAWSPGRFRGKVWAQARERAELSSLAPKGRPLDR